ncbi:DUF190 domain-containing protein [Streptomyces andamanensis]|uniref:DUF190 domain-containing protein n=1 Tax=Streptomyces andamanensis TaxID=1565035 RepID=A0ABV8TBZ9_9ACTN|nr:MULTISPECIES: DUF190 domain-containing protein [unclassified Streptomyces]EYT78689.1 hypothetical protein CF54_35640 [Streptomyces sp. Tu 6176]
MSRHTRPGLKVTVLVGENDTVHHKPLATEIVHRAHKAGIAGASVFRGVEGYGAHSRIHTQRILSLSEDLPMAVVFADSPEKVRAFLPELDGIVSEGAAILEECELVRFTPDDRPGA